MSRVEKLKFLFKVAGTHPDLEPVAAILMGEAGGEGPEGMRAVYHVVLNRARKLGMQPLEVMKIPRQFSILNNLTPEFLVSKYKNSQNPLEKSLWEAAKAIALNPGADPTGGATHYYNSSKANPSWGNSKTNPCWIGTGKIGNHVFGQERTDPMWGAEKCIISESGKPVAKTGKPYFAN
jgi:spore germination cell wall hydrolase CwlJ-like protein